MPSHRHGGISKRRVPQDVKRNHSQDYKGKQQRPTIPCCLELRRRRSLLEYSFLIFLGATSLWFGGRWVRNRWIDFSIPSTPAPAPLDPVTAIEWVAFQEDYKNRFKKDPPSSLKEWLSYAKKYQCNERQFYQRQENDLKYFRNIIEKEGRKFRQEEIIPHGLQQSDNYMGIRLENHKITVTASKNFGNNYGEQSKIEHLLRWLLEPVRVHTPAMNATYFFNLHDGGNEAKDSTVRPVFSICKQSYWTDDNQLPTRDDRSHLLTDLAEDLPHSSWNHHAHVHHKDFHDWAAFASRDVLVPYHFGLDAIDLPPNEKAVPFEQRKNAIVWRGSTTGSVWGESPRFRLIRDYGGTKVHPLSEKVPEVDVDFSFVDILQDKDKQWTLPPGNRAGRENRLLFQQQQEHKYIMDVDGNAFTARFPSLLNSGSLIFKSTRYKEWYTERLQPYVDYIPVNYNLSDLVEKIEWAHQNPDLTSKMVDHAQHIAQTYLRKEDMRCYTYRLMLEYQTLFEN